MATESSTQPDRPSMTVADLLSYTQAELDADAERQAKVSAASAGELPRDAQTGVTVDLSHKNIRQLPVEVISLIKDRVERLALSHNPQITLPSQIIQCERLRYLNLRWNQLKEFPDSVLKLSSLEILDISKNRITEIPEEIKLMTSLRFLAIARNKITRLPLALGDMTSLSKLKFDENPIEYPPLDVLQKQQHGDGDKEKDMCQQVKRFLKAASLRERLRTNSEDDTSESNAETPRPPRRAVTGGRFPVRPSMSGIDNIEDLKLKSPPEGLGGAPPIPMKSHARGPSGNTPPTAHPSSGRRPGVTPLLIGSNDTSRSRSETVSSTSSVRSRRQGFVPRKNNDFNGGTDSPALPGMRSNHPQSAKSFHSRETSSSSTLNGFLSANSGGETSSGAVSPIDGQHGRFGPPRTGLSSLPENRNSKVRTNDAVKAARRLHYTFGQLHRPVKDVVMALKDGAFKRSALERSLLNSHLLIVELDRALTRVGNNPDESNPDTDMTMRSLNSTAIHLLKAHGTLVQELHQSIQRMVMAIDPVFLRCLMNQIYYTMVEARNLCSILGFRMSSPRPKSTPRASRAWSSKTVTPTQAKPITNRRMRGATILQNMSNSSSVRAMPPPPVPLNSNDSRSNPGMPLGSVTPRSTDTFSTVAPSAFPSRRNTMRSVTEDNRPNFIGRSMEESDNEEQLDRIFLKTRNACDLAAKSLPYLRAECISRKETAATTEDRKTAFGWSQTLQKCDAMISANYALYNRLKMVKLKDPAVRNQRDFFQLCDTFVHSWTDLADEMKSLGLQRIDMSTIKNLSRPVQKAVKEVSKTVAESPLYQQSQRPPMAMGPGPQLGPPFPLNTSFGSTHSQQNNNNNYHGYITPVPATPLSAALGPAAQATVASTPNMSQFPSYDYNSMPPPPPGGRGMHERNDTVMQYPPGHGRR